MPLLVAQGEAVLRYFIRMTELGAWDYCQLGPPVLRNQMFNSSGVLLMHTYHTTTFHAVLALQLFARLCRYRYRYIEQALKFHLNDYIYLWCQKQLIP